MIKLPSNIEVRGAKVNNLKNVDIDIPLHKFVVISGRSGSGKSSLAMGVLYAEGMRRYVSSLSTYTRRRLAQAKKTNVSSIKNIPSAIALKQRPSIPDVRSTVGTMTETLNLLRLIFSRIGSPVCPNGHRMEPTIDIARAMDLPNDGVSHMGEITCPTCHVAFNAYSAEDFAFNSYGACPTCNGSGTTKKLDIEKLISNPKLTIREGAVESWKVPGRNFMPYVVEQAGINIDTPYEKLSDKDKEFILNGQEQKYEINIPTKSGKVFHMDNAIYENAKNAIIRTFESTDNPKTLQRLEKFYSTSTCSTCHGSRFNPELFTQVLVDKNIAEVSDMELAQLLIFIKKIKQWLPKDVFTLGNRLLNEFKELITPLIDLGLDYLTLSRPGSSLSTGELQRIQLSRTLRTETTGVLYVLDEPSIGLHPSNVDGLIKIIRGLVRQGNSVVVVDHDTSIISSADYIVEIGPESGTEGGEIVAQGTLPETIENKNSLIRPFLNGTAQIVQRPIWEDNKILYDMGSIDISISNYHNIKHVSAGFPVNKFTVISGFSGAGKSTLLFDALMPALQNNTPNFVTKFNPGKIKNAFAISAAPIGKNIRSTVATYTTILDDLRDIFSSLAESKRNKLTKKSFSYNLQDGACPTCNGTGEVNLDIQFLPDMQEICPACHGDRYNKDVLKIKWQGYSIADILKLNIEDSQKIFSERPKTLGILRILEDIGLGYLTLGESTMALSGGESQRLRLSKFINKTQKNSVFIFDEPTIGLHPLDVQILIKVIQKLIMQGATVIAIEHDLDMIRNADFIIDMGPGGGTRGGEILAEGTVDDIISNSHSVTGKWIKKSMK